MKSSTTKLILLFLLTISFSCEEISQKAPSNEVDKNTSLKGSYHFLEDTGTKVFLPNGFERYSLTKYQRLLDSLTTKKEYKVETERLNSLSKMDGSLYIYYDSENASTYTINTMPYYAFTRNDASQLLGMIQANNERVKKNSDAKFERITAKYGGTDKQQLFKAIYKVNGKSMKREVFNNTYIISSNEKTVFIQLSTASETDFDPYIEKMVIK
ncbi:hypothetical protein U0L90_07180 [Flavobacteriaceae sp. LMIT009]